MKVCRAFLLLCWLMASFVDRVSAAEIAPCISCHPAETKLHEGTRMAHAMLPVAATDFANHLPDQPLHESADGYLLRFSRGATDQVTVHVSQGKQEGEGIIRWVLGAGSQGQTPLVRAQNGDLLEGRVSYFNRLNRYGITIDQNPGASPNPQSALGLKFNDHDTKRCIACHVTGVTADFEPAIPGIQCERCHPGANEHATDPTRAKIPKNPGRFGAVAQVRFCGTCHRSEPPVDQFQLENVRFQPLRMMKSSCFRSEQLACTTCHPAHQDAKRGDAAFYNSRCNSCHASVTASHRHSASDERSSGNCIGCHMPYVELHPGLHFTDHFIRVVKPGDLPADTLRKREDGFNAPLRSSADAPVSQLTR